MKKIVALFIAFGFLWFLFSTFINVMVNAYQLSNKNTIRNYTSHSTDEIQELLTLLPKPYQEMNIKIELYKNPEQFKKKLRYRLYSKEEKLSLVEYMKVSKGFYSVDEHRIYLFTDKFPSIKDNDKPTKLLIAASLYHEMRHAYQWTYEKELHKLEYITPDHKDYATQPVEEDAESFAEKCMDSFHNEISKILDIDFLWYYKEGSHLMVDL